MCTSRRTVGKPIFFYRGLTLNELLQIIEEDDHNEVDDEISLTIMPPKNSCEEVTDEDSGDEDHLDINNLPGSQLLAEAEIFEPNVEEDVNISLPSDSGSDDNEENLPLSDVKRLLKNSQHMYVKKNYAWRNHDLTPNNIEVPKPQIVQNENSVIELFSLFWGDEVIDLFVYYSNMYATSKNRVGNITKEEMKNFLAILLLSGYQKLPRRRMYWENSSDTQNQLVINSLSRDRFEYIFSNLHCCDNTNLDKTDRFAKVRLLINKMNSLFQQYAPVTENHSVDEAMVPYYGRHGCKQFIRGKPIRYGYKLWTGCTSKGYVIWVEPYQGTEIKPCYKELGLGPSVILQYTDIINSIQSFPYHIFCDNFFTTIPLLSEMTRRNLKITGTIRENRTSKCPLANKSQFKKKSRGFIEYKTNEENTVVVKWHDNNVVTLASNALPVHPTHSVSRYSLKEKKKIKVDQHHNIFTYNKYMGGVDRADQNISLYRIGLRGKKWYIPLIFHMLDLAVQNAWQLHREQNGKRDHLGFRRRIVMTILEGNQRKFAKRSKLSQSHNREMRYDRIDHLIVTQGKQTRCRMCHKKVSTKCEKCDAALHVVCFKPYYVKEI
ncbi:piggyBac transposable element-derived protein 3-like [Diorhabda carinulata]|uniref:piggyBac transposable element-derived protein 3-like n=1 Tax=Diorhabda carinulata TaxID=1163345 RepID=UPI0025A08242|nr:piggyBac transposable element-derived protein 3-like [Diorhabda carinulata]